MKIFALVCTVFLLTFKCFAAEPVPIKIGLQAAGTLAWELAILQSDDRFKNDAYRIETQELANAEAGKIALQSGSVDIIVADWIWVSRLRADGADFTFYPYSTTSGALIVPENSTIKSTRDLSGKHLGIAGGELDKNWLLLQALGKQENIDLVKVVDKVYGAPPLIDEQLRQGRIDAALNYWHFAAKLETQGFRQVIDGQGILKALGVEQPAPTLGYVFSQSWADKNKTALNAFFKAATDAKNLLCDNDSAWAKIIPLLQTDDKAVQQQLHQRYCEGKVNKWTADQEEAAERIYALLKKVSDNQLTGKSEKLQPGTFWQAN